MAEIIAICNQKGGVGKTTTCLNVGAYLAIRGRKTLIIDFDPQANATKGLGINYNSLNKSIYHLILGSASSQEVISPTKIFGLEIIPSSVDLNGAQIELLGFQNKEERLEQIISQIEKNYQYILIDLPPSLGLLTVNGLVASKKVLIPVQSEFFALEGLKQLIFTLDLIRRNLGKDLKILGAVLTLFDKRSRLSRLVEKNLRRNFPGYVFKTVIPKNVSLAEAPSFGKTIIEYNPFSSGARAYFYLTQEIINLLEKEQ
ncbi:MAG: ParA family protein [Minisyncoccia bacterium]